MKMKSYPFVLAAALVLQSCSTVASTSAGNPTTPGNAQVPADFRTVLADVARQQQVEVVWQGGPYSYKYESSSGTAVDASTDELARSAASIARELRQYPDGFLRQAGLRSVVLVRDLFVAEDGGARGVAAYIFDDRLFLDVPNAERAIQAGMRVKFIHHIIWHRLDERAGTMWQDPVWVALNPPAFQYGVYSRGGVHESRAGSGSLTTEYPGFLNLYSTGNLPDDKAEVFAYLMVIPGWMQERSRLDEYLGRKVAEIKARLAALDPAFNNNFWTRMEAAADDAARYGPRR